MSREHDIAFVDVSVLLSCIGKSRRDLLHYVNVSVLIKIHKRPMFYINCHKFSMESGVLDVY